MNQIEFKKGDFVTSTWGFEKRVFKILLKPKIKSRVLYLTIEIDGVRKEMLAQWMRHADSREIENGVRD